MTVAILPDAEAILVGHLAGHSLITAFTGIRVATVIQPTWTGDCIRVARVGGTLLGWYADAPVVQLDCWSSTDDASGVNAMDIARNVVAALADLPGQHGAAWVANVDIAAGPLPEADDNGRPRVRVDVSMETYVL